MNIHEDQLKNMHVKCIHKSVNALVPSCYATMPLLQAGVCSFIPKICSVFPGFAQLHLTHVSWGCLLLVCSNDPAAFGWQTISFFSGGC